MEFVFDVDKYEKLKASTDVKEDIYDKIKSLSIDNAQTVFSEIEENFGIEYWVLTIFYLTDYCFPEEENRETELFIYVARNIKTSKGLEINLVLEQLLRNKGLSVFT